jgi:hypothetical protein
MTPTPSISSHNRISPEQLAAADRAREYWAQRRVVRDDAQVLQGTGLDAAGGDRRAGLAEPSAPSGQHAG